MDKVKGILGIDVGEFDLRLEQPSYRLGDTIRGTFQFVLKKPRSGSRVWVAVRALRTTKYTEKNEEGRTQTHTEEDEIFADERHLDGQREYFEGRYEFAFPLPEHIEGFSLGGVDAALDRLDDKYRGLAQGAWNMIQKRVSPDGPKSDSIVWTVTAGVNFPWAVSPKKSVRINVGRNLHPSAPGWTEPERNRDTLWVPPPAAPPPPPPPRDAGLGWSAPAPGPAPAPAPAPAPHLPSAAAPSAPWPAPAPGGPPAPPPGGASAPTGAVCGGCGAVSARATAKFCNGCGAALQRTCACGERLEATDRFCTSCGARTG